MAQSNRRDIELALSITTANAEALSKLRDDVRDLAKSGGDAAPQFKVLADELGKLEAQARALSSLEQVTQSLKENAAGYEAARATAREFQQQLQQLQAATEAAKAAQAQAAVAYRAANAEVQDAAAKIRELKRSTDDHTASNTAYIARLRELQAAEEQARRTKRELGVELEKARANTQAAAAAQAALTREYQALKPTLAQTTRAYEAQEREAKALIDSLNRAGVEAKDFGTAQTAVVSALEQVKTSIRNTIAEIDRKQAAERAAAQEAERLALIELSTRRQLEQQARAEAEGILRDYARMEQAQREAAKAAEAAARAQAQAQKEAAQAAESAAQRINAAFNDVGTKSVSSLREQITRVRESMQLLASSGAATGAELDQAMRRGQARIAELEREIREATGSLTVMDRAAGLLKTTIGQLAAFVSVVEIVQRMGRAFLDATKQIEGLRLGLTAIYKDAGLAARQIEVLRTAANASGLAIGDISNAFVKFSASAQASNIPLEQSNALFQALTRAAGTLGLSGAKAEAALEALSQMAAKGVVNMEELRQQLGDALPGALALTAQGLGITQQELFKLVEAGGLTARDLFPALTKALQGISGEINTLNANWARLRNVTTLAFQALGDAGVLDVLKGALQGVTFAVKLLALGLVTITEALTTQIRQVGAFVGVLQGGGGLREALQAAAEVADQGAERLFRLRDALFATDNEAKKTKTAAEQLGLSVDNVGAAFVQFGVGAAKANEILETQRQLAEKTAAAIEIEGQTRVAVAQITGDQTAILEANAAAAQANAAAQQQVAAARTAEADALRVQIEAAQLMAGVTAEEQAARADYIKKLQEQLTLKEADARKSREQADAARIAAEAAQVQAQAAQDNSARQKELLTIYQEARAALDALVLMEKEGLTTKQAVQLQTEAVAKALALYRDAAGDANRELEAQRTLEQANVSLKETSIRALIAEQQSIMEVAKARGMDFTAQQAANEIKRLEIELLRLSAEAKRADASAMLASAEATRAAAIATGSWTSVQEAGYQATVRKVEILRKEAEIADITADKLEKLARITDKAGNSANDASGKYDRLAGSIDRVNQATEERLSLAEREFRERESWGPGPNQTTGLAGPAQLEQIRRRFATTGQLTPQDAQQLMGLVDYFKLLGSSRALTGEARMQASRYLGQAQELLAGFRPPQQQSAAALPALPAQAPASMGASSTPVTINLGGASTRVNVASPADASALESVLRQLTQNANRATI